MRSALAILIQSRAEIYSAQPIIIKIRIGFWVLTEHDIATRLAYR
jgi:hypothetical protein